MRSLSAIAALSKPKATQLHDCDIASRQPPLRLGARQQRFVHGPCTHLYERDIARGFPCSSRTANYGPLFRQARESGRRSVIPKSRLDHRIDMFSVGGESQVVMERAERCQSRIAMVEVSIALGLIRIAESS